MALQWLDGESAPARTPVADNETISETYGYKSPFLSPKHFSGREQKVCSVQFLLKISAEAHVWCETSLYKGAAV